MSKVRDNADAGAKKVDGETETDAAAAAAAKSEADAATAAAAAAKSEADAATAAAAAAKSEADAATIGNLQTMVGELVKDLGVQDGYELADTVDGLQNQLGELRHRKQLKADHDAAAAAAPKKGDFVIPDGVSITTKRGVLGAGEVITEEDLPGGKDSLATLVKNGVLTKVK